jgi:hypothetical protein
MFTLIHDVSPKVLVQIGDITVSFALLESSVRRFIGSFILGTRRVSKIVTAELSFKQLRALAISLYKERYGENEDFRDISALMKRAAKLEEERNRITHSEWSGDEATETAFRIKTTAKEFRGIHFQFQEMGEAELAQIATDLVKVASEITLFQLQVVQGMRDRLSDGGPLLRDEDET